MTAAPGPLGAPAGVATIQPAGVARYSGRWAEAALLGVALVLGLGGFVLTALNRTGSSPAQTVGVAIAFLVLTVLMHLCVRYAAPWADPVLLPTAVALNGIGLAMIRRLDLAYEANEQWQFYVGSKQLVWTLLGVILFAVTLLLLRDYRRLRRWDRWAMWSGLVFLVLPFIPGIGQSINGARIWIRIGPMSFQPAELSKVLLAVFFASYLVANRDNLALAGRKVLWMSLPRARHLGPLFIVWGVSIGVLVLQKDLGSSVLLFGLFVVVLYVATDRPSWLLIGAALFLPAAWFAATHLNHVQQRINGWLHATDNAVYNAAGGSWQLLTGMFGMSTGGLMGAGWGKGSPTLVTFANSDFIFASLGEELGLTGTLVLLMLYLVLIQRGLRTAVSLRDGFGKLLAVGLSFAMALPRSSPTGSSWPSCCACPTPPGGRPPTHRGSSTPPSCHCPCAVGSRTPGPRTRWPRPLMTHRLEAHRLTPGATPPRRPHPASAAWRMMPAPPSPSVRRRRLRRTPHRTGRPCAHRGPRASPTTLTGGSCHEPTDPSGRLPGAGHVRHAGPVRHQRPGTGPPLRVGVVVGQRGPQLRPAQPPYRQP